MGGFGGGGAAAADLGSLRLAIAERYTWSIMTI